MFVEDDVKTQRKEKYSKAVSLFIIVSSPSAQSEKLLSIP